MKLLRIVVILMSVVVALPAPEPQNDEIPARRGGPGAALEAVPVITGQWAWSGPAGWQRMQFDLRANGNELTGAITMGDGFLDGGPVPGPGIRSPFSFFLEMGPPAGREVPLSEVPLEDLWRYYFSSVPFEIANGRIDGDTIEFDQVVYMWQSSSVASGFWPVDTFHYTGVVDGDRLHLVRESYPQPDETRFIGRHRFEFVAVRAEGSSTSAPCEVCDVPDDAALPGVSGEAPLVSTRRVDVSVFDAAGNAATDLGPGDFRILEGTVERPVEGFTPPAAPWNLIVLLDRSLTWLKGGGSDALPPEIVAGWREYQREMNSALGNAILSSFFRMRPHDVVGITVFEELIEPVLPWRLATPGRPIDLDITPLLIAPDGTKNLYGTLRSVLEAPGRPQGRTAVVVFTDGRDGRLAARWLRNEPGRVVMDPAFGLPDEGEREEFSQLLRTVGASGATVFFVAVNTDYRPEFLHEMIASWRNPWPVGTTEITGLYPGAAPVLDEYLGRVHSRMEDIASVSGGAVLLMREPGEALAILARLPEYLGVGLAYTLEYPSPGLTVSPEITFQVRDETLRVVPLRDSAP